MKDAIKGPAGYTPSSLDMGWMLGLIDKLKDGGVWFVPANGSVYQINKATKTLTLLNGSPKHVIHQRTVKVAEAIGWTVKVSIAANPDAN